MTIESGYDYVDTNIYPTVSTNGGVEVQIVLPDVGNCRLRRYDRLASHGLVLRTCECRLSTTPRQDVWGSHAQQAQACQEVWGMDAVCWVESE